MKDNTSDTFLTFRPISKKIAPYISYYYFHFSESKDLRQTFEFYPNYKHALTVYKNSEVEIDENSTKIKPSNKEELLVFYTINKKQNMKVELKSPFQKTGIVFNPLGINHFISKNLSHIFSDEINLFHYFGEEFKSTLLKVYSQQEFEDRVKILDAFFEKNFQGFDQPILKSAVQKLIQSNGAIKVAELSEKLQVNRRTLLRLFKTHTGMSVEEYRKMVMFRQALNYFKQHKNETNLTDVALFSRYYDQAHFVKHFKSITQETPTSLLSKISHIGEEDTYWYFKE